MDSNVGCRADDIDPQLYRVDSPIANHAHHLKDASMDEFGSTDPRYPYNHLVDSYLFFAETTLSKINVRDSGILDTIKNNSPKLFCRE
jgi:hypothetical protein